MTTDVGPEVCIEVWYQYGACIGSGVDFYPDQDDLRGVLEAKRICQNCVVQGICLEDAIIKREEHGIWGGTTPRDRARMIRRAREGHSRNGRGLPR